MLTVPSIARRLRRGRVALLNSNYRRGAPRASLVARVTAVVHRDVLELGASQAVRSSVHKTAR